MSSGNITYKVMVYVGDFGSHEVRCVYTTNKEKNAEKFLHEYLRTNSDVCKAYIERSYSRNEIRRFKRMREEDE